LRPDSIFRLWRSIKHLLTYFIIIRIKTQQHHFRQLKRQAVQKFNPLIATLKPQSNGPSYSSTVIGTLAVDVWAVTFGTARRELGGAAACPGPSSLYQM